MHQPLPTTTRTVQSRWPVFEEDEVAAVADVLRSGRVNQWTGPYVREFETAYAAALGRNHAIALSNGTAALEAALVALGIGPGDEVIVSPRSFFASAGCVAFVGATPVFADVDRDCQNLTAATIAPCLTARTKAILVVHLAGWPAPMEEICTLARTHGVAVVEDCAQAHGATIDGRQIGTFGEIAAFSFCQDKIISTAGEGGLLAMDDGALFRSAWAYKDHGKSYDTVHRSDHPAGFRWLHESFGTNLRMTSAQAAVGLIQLHKLDRTVATRRRNGEALLAALATIDSLRVPRPPETVTHAFYRAYAFVQPERLREGWNRDRIMTEVASRGVPCFAGSCSEIYREQAFRLAGFGPATALPVARELGETSLAFLVDQTLGIPDMGMVADTVADVMAEAAVPITEAALI